VDAKADGPLANAIAKPKVRPVTNKVPDIKGLPVRRALELLTKKGIVPVLKGQGMTVKDQKPRAGQPWPENELKEGSDDVFVLWLS